MYCINGRLRLISSPMRKESCHIFELAITPFLSKKVFISKGINGASTEIPEFLQQLSRQSILEIFLDNNHVNQC
jgi:hypothetical protein